jgi:outer membrane receptor protein involved in Fe transport
MVNSLLNVGSGRLNLYSSLSYTDGNVEEIFAGNKTKKVELPLIAPLQFKFGMDVKWSDFHFSTRLQMSGRQRTIVYVNTVDPDKRKTTTGYSLLNASADYTIRGKITFFTSIENAFNKRYFNPLPVDPSNTSSPEFAVSYQDPLRAMVGVRLALQK